VGVGAAGASPRAASPSSAHGGGCQIGSDGSTGSWPLVVPGLLAAARWRPRRGRRTTRAA
jgi:MYXO-CTERM domain-containing protein